MCPCPICATIALLLSPFLCWKWAKNLRKKHHCHCAMCQQNEQKEEKMHKNKKNA